MLETAMQVVLTCQHWIVPASYFNLHLLFYQAIPYGQIKTPENLLGSSGALAAALADSGS